MDALSSIPNLLTIDRFEELVIILPTREVERCKRLELISSAWSCFCPLYLEPWLLDLHSEREREARRKIRVRVANTRR